jgi:hypothetical protein
MRCLNKCGPTASPAHCCSSTLSSLVRIAALKTTAIVVTPHETRISLGTEPVPVPEPFAGMLTHHLHDRPNLRTAGGMIATPRLFPGYRPGKHLDAQSIMMRLRWLGINLLGARNSALGTWSPRSRPPGGRAARLQLPSHSATR